MPFPDASSVHVTAVVHDFMVIQINDVALASNTVEYSILDKDGLFVRKGHFKGLLIQLRLSNLKDGLYQLQLSTGSDKVLVLPFEKKSPEITDTLTLHSY
jgi:hypothetical protein